MRKILQRVEHTSDGSQATANQGFIVSRAIAYACAD